MMPRRLTLPIFLLLLSCKGLLAQEVSLKSNRGSMLIGEQAEVTLSAQFNPALHRVQFPVLPDTFNRFEIIERGKRDTVQHGS